MLTSWLRRRKWRRLVADSNLGLASLLLARQFRGAVIPNILADRLDSFIEQPTLAAALSILKYDPRLTAVFELSRSGGITERLFVRRCQGDETGESLAGFPADVSPEEVDDVAREMRLEIWRALDERQQENGA